MKVALLLPLALLPVAPTEAPAGEQSGEQAGEARSPTQRFEALREEADAAYRVWAEEATAVVRAAEAAGEEPVLPPDAFAAFYPRFFAAAEDYSGTDEAVPFLAWVVDNALYTPEAQGEVQRALGVLRRSHLASQALVAMAPTLLFMEGAFDSAELAELAGEIEAVTPSPAMLAHCVFLRLKETLTREPTDSEAYLAAKAEVLAVMAKAEASDEAEELFMLESTFASEVLVREKFGIGMVAPDIVGVDLDGVEFRLSDYRGKVVFLDFWGHW